MAEVPIEALREAIRNLHGCESTFVESVPVIERFRGHVWEGAVVVFDLVGHPTARRAYSWSTDVPGTSRQKLVAVLHRYPVDSPATAVRASIIAESKDDPPVYAETRRCVEALMDEGLDAEARELDSGLYGSTGGECLTIIGAALDQALRAKPGPSPCIRPRLVALLADVDRRLRSAGQIPPPR